MLSWKKAKIILLASLLFWILLTSVEAAIDLKKVNRPEDLPGELNSIARAGDYLINDGRYLYLIGERPRDFREITYHPFPEGQGAILALVPADFPSGNRLIAGQLQIRIGFDYYYPGYQLLKTILPKTRTAPLVLEFKADFTGRHQETGEIRTTYSIYPEKGLLKIKSVFRNSGQKAIDDLTLSVYFNALHSYHFNPYHQKYFPDLNFRVYQKKDLYLAWVNLGSQPPALPDRLLPGQQVEFNYALIVRREVSELLAEIYSLLKKEVRPAEIIVGNPGENEAEIVVEEILSSSVFFRHYCRGGTRLNLWLPEGIYRLRASLFPAVVEKTIRITGTGENRFEISRPATGQLKIRLLDRKGEPLPGKITFFGLGNTRTPYFQPENPVASGRSWERFKNVVYTHPQPLEVELAAGQYLAIASYGPFYTTSERVIEILEGQKQEISFRLEKAVELKGYLSVDPHLHTINSDGSLGIRERLKSIVAENIDVAISTDHNYVTDYQQELNRLRLNSRLKVFPGVEVTPLNSYLHFNNFPVEVRSEEKTAGSIIPAFERVEDFFRACIKKNPASLLQLNHPRAGRLGYFENIKLDPERANSAEGDLDLSFDLIEVMNGAVYYGGNDQAIKDWLNLLNKGYFFAAVGSSDSHGAAGSEPGYSRVVVRYPGKLSDLSQEELASALKKGQSFVTNGPVVDLVVDNLYRPGDLLTARKGRVKVRLRVLSAPWVEIDEVRLIVNGERKIIFPVPATATTSEKFNRKFEVELPVDSYLAVEAIGFKSLYPVVQQPARNNKLEEAALPYALTNPVFVDVDGNGRFDAPRPAKIKTAGSAGE
ncbi:MAG: CehA/McbA family metallohydrolase [Candidatus Saccharicenans sp.]